MVYDRLAMKSGGFCKSLQLFTVRPEILWFLSMRICEAANFLSIEFGTCLLPERKSDA